MADLTSASKTADAAITTRTSDAATGAAQLQASNCSTEGNYTATDAYAANLNQLLAELPSTTVSKNGGFFSGTVGQGAATVYGLALCSADFSRSDCDDCLTAASSSASGLVKRCRGSVTASIMFDQCMLRYSNRNFFGNNETDIIFTFTSSEIVPFRQALSNNLKQGLAYLSTQAALSPERFAASGTAPYALVQCTWDLPPDKCKACIDTLSANASDLFQVGIEGELKSYSCRVRYSNASFTVVPLVAPAPAPTMNRSADPTGGPGPPSSAAGSSSSSRNSNKAIVAGAVTVTVIVVLLVVVLFCVTRRSYYYYIRFHPNKKGETQMDGTSAAHHREEDRSNMQPGARVMNNSNNVETHLHVSVHPLSAGVSVTPGANANATKGTESNNRGPPPVLGPSSSAMEAAGQQQQADEDRSMQLQLARHGDPDIATTGGNNSSSAQPKVMALEFLRQITNNFSKQQILGTGTFGTVYQGEHNGKRLAVKLLRSVQSIENQEREFKIELENLWKLNHPNIVRLLGYCYETKRKRIVHEGEPRLAHIIDRALCFEFMHKGSLQQHLADESCGLDWQTRYKIIKGTCEGLKYLHKGLENPMFHLDLKPGNILLDKNMVPKLADFGLSKLVGDNQTQATSSILGTIRYCPPEHIKGYLFSDKFDIFSLGVVMIEIIAGPEGYPKADEMSSQGFIDHIQENWRKRKRIHGATPGCTLPNYECRQVKRCIEIALECVRPERMQRPDIEDIIRRLKETENNTEKSDL